MFRWRSALVVLSAAIGCSVSPTESAAPVSSPEMFAGAWRSVTPSLEFIRLSVVSKSSEQGVLAARLTFSGLAWEGSGRIQGDSLVAHMTTAGTSRSSGTIVARASEEQALRVQVRPVGAAPIELRLVRGN